MGARPGTFLSEVFLSTLSIVLYGTHFILQVVCTRVRRIPRVRRGGMAVATTVSVQTGPLGNTSVQACKMIRIYILFVCADV